MKNPAKLLFPALISFSSVLFAGPVDINSADAETIAAELKGVGSAKAAAIIEYRNNHGAFKSADELVAVKGIGERTVEINRQNIQLGSK